MSSQLTTADGQFTDEEVKILKSVAAKAKAKNEKRLREDADIKGKYDSYRLGRPEKVVVGGVYSQFIPGGLYAYHDHVLVGRYPGVPSGYLWNCTSGKPIPNQRVADLVNAWLVANK